jgi:predicted transposase YbfD/YdcC
MSIRQGSVTLTTHFEEMTDPRMARTRLHSLVDVIAIAILGTICGADYWEELPRFGAAKLEWLKKYLKLPNGIPSADTFCRVFQRLDPDEFMKCMSHWVSRLREETGEEIVGIDGQTLRGSGFGGCRALHMVRAWASENRLVLGQVVCDKKSNEITAIPDLLKLIQIQGAIVTIDAMGTQAEIAKTIRERKADYVLPVKGNQPKLAAAVGAAFDLELDRQEPGQRTPLRYHRTFESHAGREEERMYYVMPVPKDMPGAGRWKDLKSIGMVIRRRVVKGVEELHIQYYISSLSARVKRFARAVRGHWSIENKLHWMLDVNFAQDASTTRKGHSPEIASMLRQLALMLLTHYPDLKGSIKGRRKVAGWNNGVLEQILAHFIGI